MSSHRQIEANKKNASLSTGPKTDEGKAVSRGNAIKHNLSGEGTVCTEAEQQLKDERIALWRPSFENELQGNDPDRERLFEEVVVNSLRIEKAHRREMNIQATIKDRSANYWDADRKHQAETLGAGLTKAKNPALIVTKLNTFLHGIEWLISQWTYLKYTLESGDALSEDQVLLFEALLECPHRFRNLTKSIDKTEALPVILQALEKLEGPSLDGAREYDAYERAVAVQHGFLSVTTREELLNRRYEDQAQRRFLKAKTELRASASKGKIASVANSQSHPTSRTASQANVESKPQAPQRPAPIRHEDFEDCLEEVFRSEPSPARNEANGISGKLGGSFQGTQSGMTANQVRISPSR